VNFFTFMIAAVYVFYASRTLGLSAGVIGITLGIGAGGALLGAVVAPGIGRRLGLGPTTVIGCLLFAAPFALLPLATGLNSLNALATPHRLRARLAGASRFFNYGTRPFGALLGGILAGAIGVRPMLLLASVGAVLSVVWLLASPIAGIHHLEQELDL
jgi:MFS-type transporter involved in bile tolerance (Atg22 family)